METMIKTMRRTISRRLDLRRDLPIVVAVSGGADSVALLAALNEEGYECVAAHCNFHLRGEESLRDMRFVENLTQRLGIDLYVRDFDVPAAMAATGESVEMACRRLRYEWFEELLTTLRASDVAVGHHREDNVETFFLNLSRGTGIAGLTGIDYRRGAVVRPLLDCSRAQIEEFLSERGLDFVTDSSNMANDYQRNRLRNVLLPMFEELMPGSLDATERTMSMLGDARRLYDRAVADAADRYGTVASGSIDVGALSADPDARILLFELLRPASFSMTHVDNILADPMRSGAIFRAGGMCAELSRGTLTIAPDTAPSEQETEVSLHSDITEPLHIAIEMVTPDGEFRPEISPAVAYLDAKALEGAPRWTLRHWRRGDRMQPFGMKGSRLVSDIFSDAKMTAAQKRDTWLLCRDEKIVWIVGVRASAHYAVGRRTRRYLVLRMLQS